MDPGRHVILLGLGSGRELMEIWDEFGRKIDLLLIFERNSRQARAVMSHVLLAPLLADESVHLFIGLPAEEIRRTLHPFRYMLGMVEPTIVNLSRDPEVEQFRHALEDELLLIRQCAELVIQEKGRPLFNVLRNLPAIVTSTSIHTLRGRFAGHAAFVVAAGPSLDTNIGCLPDAAQQGLVFAVDTALRPLQKANVEPHLLVTFDPTPLNARHFTGWPDLGKTVLAFHPEVYAEIPRTYLGKAPLVVLHDGEDRLLRSLGLAPPPGQALTRGIMTGHLAFNLAVYLGCDPVILVGMDLSFSGSGGRTHARATALSRRIRVVEGSHAKIGPIPGSAVETEAPLVDLPAADGGKVQGPPIFRTYLRLLEQEIARSGRHVIDATEGGTRKARTQVMSLQEAVRLVEHQTPPKILGGLSLSLPAESQIASMVSVLSRGWHRLARLKEWAMRPCGPAEWFDRLLCDPEDWILPAYESLIYKTHGSLSGRRDDTSQSIPNELREELVNVCDHFSLFILGAIEELKNLPRVF